MRWVTRENVRVDRVACPWLIKRFVDPDAEFLFVPREKVLDVAKEQDAIPYDSPGAELFHYKESGDERCSFDAIIKKYKLVDPAVLDMAEIVRSADAAGTRCALPVRTLTGSAPRLQIAPGRPTPARTCRRVPPRRVSSATTSRASTSRPPRAVAARRSVTRSGFSTRWAAV